MKYLNLTADFAPLGVSENYISFDTFVFNGGEPHIKIYEQSLSQSYTLDDITITIRLSDSNSVMILLLAVDALRRIDPKYKLHLFTPYFPAARQDRVMIPGEPLSVKVYADLINSCKFQSVTIVDPHSDVTPALLNNVIVKNNHKFVLSSLRDLYPQNDANLPILISPDAGSNKKIQSLARFLTQLNTLKIVKCDKTRDVRNGNITNFEVYSDDLGGKDCVIVDDICDGGGTFIGLAKELKKKNAGNLYLMVTHGIFSKDINELLKVFDKIYTTDSVNVLKYQNGIISPNLKVINLQRN